MTNLDTKGLYAEFMVFLLIYASYADYELSTSEITRIKSKFDPVLVDKIILKHDKMSEYERLNYIKKNKSHHLRSAQDLKSLSGEIKAQFKVDGQLTKLEKGLNNFLDHMIAEQWN